MKAKEGQFAKVGCQNWERMKRKFILGAIVYFLLLVGVCLVWEIVLKGLEPRRQNI